MDLPMTGDQRLDWLSLLQLVLSSAAAVLLGLFSAAGLLMAVFSRMFPSGDLPAGQLDSLPLLFSGMGLVAVLLIPSAVFSASSLLGISIPGGRVLPGARWLIVVLLPLLAVGYFAARNLSWGAFVLPVIHVLVNGAVVFWLIFQVRKGLPEGSRQRFWGVFASGLLGSPLLALILEIILLGGVILFWAVYLQGRPALNQELLALVERISRTAFTPEMVEELAGKYLFRPGVLWTLFLYIAVLIPVIEEVIKPLGVWLLLGRDLEPREGFSLGAVSGAAYGLFENLTLAATTQAWFEVVVSRFGTTAVHILTSGLVGWGMVMGFKQKRWRKLGLAYGAAVLVHGLWNGLNILLALGAVDGMDAGLGPFWSRGAEFGWLGLVVLAVGSLIGLFQANFLLKRAIMSRAEITRDK